MRFVPTPYGLTPYDVAAREFLASRPNAEPFEVEVLHERDMFEHRKILARINDLARALGRPAESVRAELLFETGNFQVLGELFGKTVIAVNSMSRHAMRDHELHSFWHDAKEVIRSKLLPHITDEAERTRLSSMLLDAG